MKTFITVTKLVVRYHVLGIKQLFIGLRIRALLS